MKSAYVSVIIPAYNCAHFIEKAIDSALCQDVELEVIVVNDCSTDNLDSVMEKYSQLENVVYITNENSLGAAKSRNKGVAFARGEYIAFLDGDDIWREGKLKKQLDLMEKTDSVLCTTAREIITADGFLTGKIIPTKTQISYKKLLRHNCISCSSVVIKREVALEFPMHHEDSHEDYIMWLEVLNKYDSACGINEPLLLYRSSSTGKSGSKLQSAKKTFMVYRYMGFGIFKSLACFCSYALNGAYKHFIGGRRK